LALAWCREQRLAPWERSGAEREERTGPGADGRARLRNLVVREGRASGALQLRVVTTQGELDGAGFAAALAEGLGGDLSGALWTRSVSLAETTAGGETELLSGEPQLPERLGELDLRISAEAFFQTNTEMAQVLYGIAAELAAGGPFQESRAAHRRNGAAARGLRVVQPDDARAERVGTDRVGPAPAQRAPRRHVPAHAPHRVRGAFRAWISSARDARGDDPRG